MLKIKHERECDCVVAGFRWHKDGDQRQVGSLLLGLFDDAGKLQHVGVCASFPTAKRRELVEFLGRIARIRSKITLRNGRRMTSRPEIASNARRAEPLELRARTCSWEPVRPELVVEVAYDHMQGDRFRHTAQFRRWRFDKKPRDCTYAQLEVVPPEEVAAIFKRRSTA